MPADAIESPTMFNVFRAAPIRAATERERKLIRLHATTSLRARLGSGDTPALGEAGRGDVVSPGILHVVHSLTQGGTERTLIALLRALATGPFRHAVATLREAGPLAAELPDMIACRPIGALRARRLTPTSRIVSVRLARYARRFGTRIIHARNTGCWADATLAAWLTPGAQLVLGFHGLESATPLPPRRRRIAGWACRTGAKFTTVSQAGKTLLVEQARIPAERITVLPNGVDREAFKPQSRSIRQVARTSFEYSEKEWVVGIVGSLTTVKGHDTLLAAAACIAADNPHLRLLIVGDGPLRATLAQEAQAAGVADRVRFTGWRDDVPAILSAMDVFVCASESEGMSNAMLEAMAAGLPIVATSVGDHSHLLRHGIEGLLVPPGAPRAMAGALAQLARDQALRQRFATAARTRSAAFEFRETVRAYAGFYETLS